jgi:uncharacterized protein
MTGSIESSGGFDALEVNTTMLKRNSLDRAFSDSFKPALQLPFKLSDQQTDIMTTIRPNIGIYASEDEALQGLVARLVSALDPQAIWLFGSRARGDHRPDSDFDLVVVAKPGADWNEDFDAVYRATMGTELARDIVPYDPEIFEVAQELNTSFAARVVREGREVYRS